MLSLLLLLLLPSQSLLSIIPCPYVTRRPLDPTLPIFNLTAMNDLGRLGNMIVCTSNAMEIAIKCGGQLSLPPIPPSMRLSIAPEGMRFDFTSLPHSSTEDRNCSQMTAGCSAFFFVASPRVSFGLSNYHFDPETFPVLARCFHKYLSFPSSFCTLRLENALVVHIRNGDVYDMRDRSSFRYGQQPVCSLLGAMLHRQWNKIYVISEVQNANDHRSGPLIQFLRAIEEVFPVPIVFLPGGFPIHFNFRMCAVNLFIAYTTLNYINHYLPNLRILYDPLSSICPPHPPGYGWSHQRESVVVYRMSRNAIDWDGVKWVDNTTNWVRMMLSPCVKYEACTFSGR